MNADAKIAGTSGGIAGTSGDIADHIGFSRRLWASYALALLIAAGLGASSFWIEDTRNGIALPGWCYAVTELTSVSVLFSLTPLLLRWTAKLDPARLGWPRTIGGHLFGFVLGSAAHIAGMAALRYLLFPLFGQSYGFGRPGQLGLQLLYEIRKDAVIYLGMVALIWLAAAARRRMTVIVQERIVETPVPAMSAARLEIRDGAKREWIDPAEILWAEAAGNYVELHLNGRSLLQRQTLASLEDELAAQGFVRIHRSRLLNRRHLRDVQSQSSGDFTVTLSDGRQIAGSRRWRDSLKL